MIKRLISLILVVAVMMGFAIPSYAADLSFAVTASFETRSARVTGTTNANRRLTFYITDAGISTADMTFSNNIYAMHQETAGADGSFDVTMKLPETMTEGTYKLVIGGVGKEMAEASRTNEFKYAPVEGAAIKLEAETATGSNWSNNISTFSSGGRYMALAQDGSSLTQNQVALTWDFNITGATTYDVFALMSETAAHTSLHTFSVGGSTTTDGEWLEGGSLYNAQLQAARGMHWAKIRSDMFLNAGPNSLVYKPTAASAFPTLNRLMAAIDVVYIVPSSWNWEPYQLTEPIDERKVKVDISDKTTITTTEVARGENITVRMGLSVPEAVTYDLPIWAELRYKGERVTRTTLTSATPMNNWTAGRLYQIKVDLKVPMLAPDGIYEIYCGIGNGIPFNNTKTSEYYINKEVTIGNYVAPNPDTLVIESAKAVQDGTNLNVSYTLSEPADAATAKAFVRFWDGEVLWGVAESETAVSVNQVDTTVNATLKMPLGIPEGEYKMDLGFYNVNGTRSMGTITLNDGAKPGYKPLSNGVYSSKKTGRDHFWYVNQNNAVIWDGEPFVPLGGMFCAMILMGYSKTDMQTNLDNWAEDKRQIDILAEQGVTDLYFNANLTADTPTWVWEFVLDYVDKKGIRYGIQTNGGTNYTKQDAYYTRAYESTITANASGGSASVTADLSNMHGGSAVSALYTALNSSGAVVGSGKANMWSAGGNNYSFSASVPATASTVYFTPMVNKGVNVVNFADNGPAMLADVEKFVSKVAMGDNVRNIIDPATNESGYIHWDGSARPYGTKYNALYEKWLKNKYGTIAALNTNWVVSGTKISDFAQASRIIPTYTSAKDGNSGQYYIYGYDPHGAQFSFIGKSSLMWTDFLNFRDYAAAEFYNDLADEYKKELDVPVVVKNVYMHQDNFRNDRLVGGLDGIGSESYSVGYGVGDIHTTSFGMVNNFAKTGWSIVTETAVDEGTAEQHARAYGSSPSYNADGSLVIQSAVDVGYGTKDRMHTNFNALFGAGAKGIYDFNFSARHYLICHQVNSYMYFYDNYKGYDLDHFAWMREYNENILNPDSIAYDNDKIIINFAQQKAFEGQGQSGFSSVYHYPDGDSRWINYSYRGATSKTKFVVAITSTIVPDAKIMAATFANGPASYNIGKAFGKFLDNKDKDQRALYIGTRNDLGAVPQVDKYFTSEYSTNSWGSQVQILNASATPTCQVLKTASNGKPYALRDGNFWIVADNSWIGGNGDWYTGYLTLLDYGVFADDQTGVVNRSFDLKDSNGNTATSLSGGTYTLSAEYTNTTYNEDQRFVLYAAAYDEKGKLIDVARKARNIFNGVNSAEVQIEAGGGEYSQTNSSEFGGEIYPIGMIDGLLNVSMGWVKIASDVKVPAGNTKISASVKSMSDVFGRAYMTSLDAVRLVPSSWNWTPTASKDAPAGHTSGWVDVEAESGTYDSNILTATDKGVQPVSSATPSQIVVNMSAEIPATDTYDVYILAPQANNSTSKWSVAIGDVAKTVKGFIWDTNMTPIADAKVITR